MIKENDDMRDAAIISDVLVRMAALERLLLIKGVISLEELSKEINDVARVVAKTILKEAKIKGDLDKVLEDLISNKK